MTKCTHISFFVTDSMTVSELATLSSSALSQLLRFKLQILMLKNKICNSKRSSNDFTISDPDDKVLS